MRKIGIATLLGILLLSPPAAAGYEEGNEAYKQGDYQAAYREWSPLAEEGNTQAQNKMGVLYATGRGVRRDPKMAMKWFLRAAENGNIDAHINVGRLYEQGHGVQRNLPKAYLWYHMAARAPKGKGMRDRLWREMTPRERKKARQLRSNTERYMPRRAY